MSETMTATVADAYAAWKSLQDRATHPEGDFDDKRRWYPSAAERQPCCDHVRSPSAAWPFSLIKHCRSIEHVAAKFGVEPTVLLREINRHRPKRVAAPHPDHYKLVAVVDGRYLSIYDGETEYAIGRKLREVAKPDHGGGYYCYGELGMIVNSEPRKMFPDNSALADAPKAILRVAVGGRKVKYERGKVAFSEMTPVAVIEIRYDNEYGTYEVVRD